MVITKHTLPIEKSVLWETELRTVEKQENETKMLALVGVFFCDLFSSSIIMGVRK